MNAKYPTLDKCTGPACPRCGCQDSDILQKPPAAGSTSANVAGSPDKVAAWNRGSWWASGKARCGHCRAVFNFRELPEQQPEPEYAEPEPAPVAMEAKASLTTCPECGKKKFYVSRPVGKLQYRKCRDCGHTGKTSRPDEPV